MELRKQHGGSRFALSCAFVLLNVWATANGSPFDPTLISRRLLMFARDGLGVYDMQQYFNDLHYHEETEKGEKVTRDIAVELANKFKERFAVARRLKAAVEASYAKSTKAPATKQCCHVDKSTLTFDSRFRFKVNMTNLCAKVSGSASSDPIYLHSNFLETAIDISRNYPFIKWQYFASDEGVLTNYPVFDDNVDCARYDPRYRPFYVETATPDPKDVVLVIDTSSSMTGVRISVAVEAANTVLETMNPKDKVGIVSFNTDAFTPGGDGTRSVCYSERLALATPVNLNKLKDYVKGLVPIGSTFYSKAFEQAFSLLKGSVATESGERRRKVIIFLTDGEPQDDKKAIFETIQTKNQEMNNSVVILAFGFDEANKDILQAIVDQNGTNYGVPRSTSFGDITPGTYKFVKDINKLRSEMALYYKLFATRKQLADPIISVPYVDAFGTGLLVSITLPCYHMGRFIGVAGTDINMDDLLSDITYFNQGQSTYAFLISSSGRTLIHPLLPAPSVVYEEPIFMDIRTLEVEEEFDEVFSSMTKHNSGSKTFVAKRFLARGGHEKQGVTVKSVNSSYYWEAVQETDFSLGVVIPVSFKNEKLNSLEIPEGYEFRYHRVDLTTQDKPCSHFGIYSIKNSTVKFAPSAFLDIYAYLSNEETKADVDLITAYMTDKDGFGKNPGLRADIRDTVIATWKVEDLWLHKKTQLTQYFVWRYIGTANGVDRTTPGSPLAKVYDPRIRPWYYTALANTGLLALTTPYLDFNGAGVVITMARTLHRGEVIHKHNTNDEILGVMGADFPLTYFHRLLVEVYPKCAETKLYSCFVMDGAGFLIMHEDFLLSSATTKDVEQVHITEKEKTIAEDLIKKKYMIKKQCRNLKEIQKQSFYEIQLPRGGVDALISGERCAKYQLGEIVGTNALLGLAVRETSCMAESCSCFSDNTCHYSSPTCECPCTSPLEFHYCRNQFPNSSLPICPAPAPSIQQSDYQLPSTLGLQKCFDPHCEEKNSSETCDGIVSCYWCVRDKDDVPLAKPYCAGAEVCFRGKEVENVPTIIGTTGQPQGNQTAPSTAKTSEDNAGLSGGATAAIVFSCFLVVALIVFAVCLTRYYRRNQQNQPDPEKSATTEVFSRKISVNRPPAPLPPDVIDVPSRPNSEYESMDDILDHRRDSAISDAIQRSQTISLEPVEPKRSLDASTVSIPWPWPYNDVHNTPPSKKTSFPPLPAKDSQTEDGLDNSGYLEYVEMT